MKSTTAIGLICTVLALSGCRSERPEQLARCLDNVVEMRTAWRRVKTTLERAKTDPSSALVQAVAAAQARVLDAQRDAASCFSATDSTECFARTRTSEQSATQALRLAQARLESVEPDSVNSLLDSSPIQAAERGRAFAGTPIGVAAQEVLAARAATESMWQACRAVCRDLGCSGR